MKRITMCFIGVLMVLSLAACTPTPDKPTTETPTPEASPGKPTTKASSGMPTTLGTEPAGSVSEAATGGASDKVPDPNAEPMEIISVYCANQDGTGLNQAMDAVAELTPQSLIDKLIEYGILEDGTKVLKFDSDNGVGTLDISKLSASKTMSENLILTSIGNTFIENFKLDKLKLLVNGKRYSGDHSKQGDKDYLEFKSDYKKM